MDLNQRGMVVVGVDDSPEATEAAQYAARLADERGHDLLLAHAYHLASVPPVSAELITAMRLAAQGVVDRVLSNLSVPSSLRVETLVDLNPPVLMLRQLAELAEIVVVGHRHVGIAERLLLGSIAAPVTARAACPVVIVSRGSTSPGPGAGPVFVALDGETPGGAALDFAFTQAELGRTDLVAIHAMPLEELPKDRISEEVGIEEVLASWKQDHPDIPVSIHFVPGDAENVLISHSHEAAVLVVGRPHDSHFGSWSRSVARSVMSRSACPLVIVPPRRGDVELGDQVRRTGVPTYSS